MMKRRREPPHRTGSVHAVAPPSSGHVAPVNGGTAPTQPDRNGVTVEWSIDPITLDRSRARMDLHAWLRVACGASNTVSLAQMNDALADA